MRQQLPKEIDPFRFANNGRQLEGDLALATLPRLSESLYDNNGLVDVSMQFDVDRAGTPNLHGHFKATLSLVCERCMKELVFPVVIDTWLGLVKHAKLAESLAEQYEPWVIEDGELVDPATVVEDELILALPLVPKHEFDCLPEEAWFSGDKEVEGKPEEKPESPFAVLSALKSKK